MSHFMTSPLHRFLTLALLVILLVTALVAGSGGPTGVARAQMAGSEVIKIVSSLPRTGASKVQTDAIVNGIQMAIEEDAALGTPFAIVYEDLDDATLARGTWDAAIEAANARRAVNDSDVMVYVGT